jgi:hypothetical protein
MIRSIVIRGPFTEEDFNLLVETIRQIDTRHPTDKFEIAAVDPDETALEAAQAILKEALPPMEGRETEWVISSPLYPDCPFRIDCQCRQHLPVGAVGLHTTCLIHAVNRTADALGWERPSPEWTKKRE